MLDTTPCIDVLNKHLDSCVSYAKTWIALFNTKKWIAMFDTWIAVLDTWIAVFDTCIAMFDTCIAPCASRARRP